MVPVLLTADQILMGNYHGKGFLESRTGAPPDVFAQWRLLDLGELPPVSTQAIYHAVGIAVDRNIAPSTIIFCRPTSPLVCIGYHQELEMELDQEYCRMKGLPIVRRILGGGAVYLDRDQLFYQVIAKKSDPRVPASIQGIFEKFLTAPVMTYNYLGIPAHYRAVNDIEVRGRKISGSGATQIGTSVILTGNIIFDFDFDEMVRILRVPSEKFRDKVAKTLQERLTTIKRELSDPPSHDFIKELLGRNYENTLGVELLEGRLSQEETNTTESLERMYQSDDWTRLVENEHQDIINKRMLRMSGRVSLGETCYKTSGGLLRVLIEVKDDVINDLMITGDFTFLPRDSLRMLEKVLRGHNLNKDILMNRIRQFYEKYNVRSPGLTVEDIAHVIMLLSSK